MERVQNCWKIREAKARWSELIRLSEKSPQFISLRGVGKAVILDIASYNKLVNPEESLLDFFKKSPLHGVSLSLDRDKSLPRDAEG